MPEDMQWFVKGLYLLVRDMLATLKTDSRLCSALAKRLVLHAIGARSVGVEMLTL